MQTCGGSWSTSSGQFNTGQHSDFALREIAERIVSTVRLVGYY